MSDQEQQGNGAALAKPETPKKALVQILKERESEIKALAGSVLSPERLIRLAVLAVGQSPYLAKCSLASVVGSVLSAARYGLEIDGVHAAMVPMKIKQRDQSYAWEAQCWPMARGLVARAYDDATVEEISARLVYEGERFHVDYGTTPMIEHTPDSEAIATGNVVAAYAVIHMRGRAKFEVMFRSQLDAIRARSPSVRAGAFSPWTSDEGEMQKKTVLKRICKTAPLKSQRLFAALAGDDENERVETIDVTVDEPPKVEKPPERKKRTETMKQEMKQDAPTAAEEVGQTKPSTITPAPTEPAKEPPKEPAPAGLPKIDDGQKRKIRELCDKRGATRTGDMLVTVAATLDLVDCESLSDLTHRQAELVIERLSKPPAIAPSVDDTPDLGDR